MRKLIKSALAALMIIGVPIVYAEGTYQMGAAFPQPLTSESKVFVHIDSAGKYLRLHLCRRNAQGSSVNADIYSTNFVNGKYELGTKLADIGSPEANIDCSSMVDSILPATPALGNTMQFQAPQEGVYAIDFQADHGKNEHFVRWDISVADNATAPVDPTANDGNIFSYSWFFDTNSYGTDLAATAQMFALVPGGFPNTNYVWVLDLQSFSGNGYEIFANDIGLNPPYSGISSPTSGASLDEKYPTYVSYPTGANPNPAPSAGQQPALIDTFRFVDDQGNDNIISPDGDAIDESGIFTFTPDVNGTYAITIDLNRDGEFGANDRLLLGPMQANTPTSVVWDGTNAAGNVVPQAQYPVRLQLRVGEYHFVSRDVETSGGGVANGLTILRAIDANTVEGTAVYWDDETLLSNDGGVANLDGVMSSTATTGAHRHTWGSFSSGGLGNNAYIDTYVFGNASEFTAEVIVKNKNGPQITGGLAALVEVNENTTNVTDVIATGGRTPYTYQLIGPDAALFDISASGNVTFKSAPDFEAPGDQNSDNDYIVVVRVTDDSNEEAQQTLTVRVVNVAEPNPPIVVNNSITVNQGQTFPVTTANILFTDSDDDSSIILLAPFEGASTGAPGVTAGRFELIANPGVEIFNFTQKQIEDGQVQFVHDGSLIAPRLSIDSENLAGLLDPSDSINTTVNFSAAFGIIINENQVSVTTVNANNLYNTPAITFSITGGSDSSLFQVNNSGELSFLSAPDFETPLDSNADNQYVVEVTGTDTINSIKYTVTVTVDDLLENTAPVAIDQMGINSVVTTEDNATSVTLAATDNENDPLTYTIISAPTNGALSGTAPNLTYNPSANFYGTDSFTFRVNDGALDSNVATVSIVVNSINDLPTATSNSITTPEDTAIAITLSGNDIDGIITGYSVNSPTNGILSGSAPNLIYTPNADFNGSDSFTFSVTDNAGGVSTLATVSISISSVNDLPVAVSQSLSTSEDNAFAITISGNDADGTITSYAVGTPSNGTLSGTAPNLTYTPNANFNGSDSFTFSVTDNDGGVSTEATISITVAAVNDVPTADPQSVTTAEDVVLNITLTATDTDGTIESFAFTAPTNGLISGTAPNLVYTPNADFNGSDSFTFTATDNDGGTSAASTISIVVSAVNDLPTANPNSVTTPEDNVIAIILSGTDIDGTIASYSVNNPANGTLSGTAPNLTYTPNANFNGSDSFTFSVTDNDGGTSTPATVSISVSSVNDLPVAVSQSLSTLEDNAIVFTISGTDADGTITSYAVGNPSNGTLSGTAPNLTYTPNANFNGSDSFTFTVTDNEGGTSVLAIISIQVSSVNDLPSAVSQSVSTTENSPIAITISGSDADGTISSYTLGNPANGTLSGTAPNLTYTPNANFNGNDSFTFSVTDNDGGVSTEATISIVVAAVNDVPTADAQSVTTAEDVALNITLTATDTDGTIESYVLTSPTNGLISGTAPNLIYTPNADFNGMDSFSFSVTDNDGAVSNAANISITVTSVNDAPIADSQSVDVVENISKLIVLSGTDKDTANISFIIDSNPASGTLSGTEPNLTYTPAADFVGNDSFTFKANDGASDSNMATISINVLGDLDGDGDPDVTDPDDDGDGIPDDVEGDDDADGDGIPNNRDTDSDGDGLSDLEEGTDDSDGDGTPDYLDISIDEDQDGIPDIIEGIGDNDNDGIPNFLDIDSDNDGIIDGFEAGLSGSDSDGDGIDDVYDIDLTGGIDANQDGIDDNFLLIDSDEDNIADYLDVDSDNDLVPDAIEATRAREDQDQDGIVDTYDIDFTGGTDQDSDGIDDRFDVDINGGFDADQDGVSDTLLIERDTDDDGVADYLDRDSDNDSILDTVEADATASDSDGDGIVDAFDVDTQGGNDNDLDGVSDSVALTDTDNDGVADIHDLDSDNDAILDVNEVGSSDQNGDGLADVGTGLIADPRDTDTDGIADFRDLDSDNDGTYDLEGTPEVVLDQDNDGQIDLTSDTDGDGIDDTCDNLPQDFGTAPGTDLDGDGVTARFDLDDDNDGIADVTEESGNVDSDALDNYLDRDSDNDGLSDWFETDRPLPMGIDSDQDGVDDAYDVDATGGNDSDSDGIDDAFSIADTDLDGIPDYLDLDSDNDGIADTHEQVLLNLTAIDSDADGLIDSVDAELTGGSDTDFDGIDDAALNRHDVDGDGIPNFRDLDSDGDGVDDTVEGTDDSDNDGIENFLDPDSDNDGVLDGDEDGDFNGDGIPDRLQVFEPVETGLRGAGSFGGLMALVIMMLLLIRNKRIAGVVLSFYSLVSFNLAALENTNTEEYQAEQKADLHCMDGESYQELECWYLGAGVGMSRLEPEHNNSAWRSSDDDDLAVKIFGGFAFDENWFVELSYETLGEAEMTNLNPAVTEQLNIDYRAFGFSAGYWWFAQKSEWNYYAKFGLAFLETDEGQYVQQDHGSQFSLGAGVQWQFAKDWFARFGLDAYDKDAKVLGISVAHYFGKKTRTPTAKPKTVVKPAFVVRPEPMVKPTEEVTPEVNPDLDGDGVLNSFDQCPDSTQGIKVDENGCLIIEKITLHIQFDTASTVVKNEYLTQLEKVVAKIRQLPNVKVTVAGHTDWQGSELTNQTLSKGRAAAVAKYLMQETELDADQIEIVGHGESKPIADNRTVEGRYKNRRVEILIVNQ